jgi:DNA polymerase-3 subunit delta
MTNFNNILKDLKQGKYAPVYFLFGEEPFYIDVLTKHIEHHALPEDQRSFNQVVLYGGETDMLTVIGEAKRYPMMADRVVVIVKEAQQIRDWEPLENYLDQPQQTTVLVFAHKHKKPDKRKKVFKKLSNASVFFESAKVRDYQIVDWIASHTKTKGFQATEKAILLLAESLGTDLGRIDSELNKLRLVVPAGEKLDEQVIEDNIGISKDYNNFELIKALAHKDFDKALRIQHYFAANPKDNPLVLTIGLLFGYFSKLLLAAQTEDKSPGGLAKALKVNPYVIKDYTVGLQHYNLKASVRVIGYLREYDLKSKGVGNSSTPPSELLRELLFKIIYL